MLNAQKVPPAPPAPVVMAPRQIRWLGTTAKAWQRQNSSWSVWNRFATFPLLLLAVWSHAWFGPTPCGVAVIAVCLWIWFAPRWFPKPRQTDSWSVRALFGERIWVNRHLVPVEGDISRAALVYTLMSSFGFVLAAGSAYETVFLPMLAGVGLTYAGKVLLLRQLADLYTRMKDTHPLYRAWQRVPGNDNHASYR